MRDMYIMWLCDTMCCEGGGMQTDLKSLHLSLESFRNLIKVLLPLLHLDFPLHVCVGGRGRGDIEVTDRLAINLFISSHP